MLLEPREVLLRHQERGATGHELDAKRFHGAFYPVWVSLKASGGFSDTHDGCENGFLLFASGQK